MTAILHPFRYKDSLNQMLTRLERLAPGVSTGKITKSCESLLREEMAGIDPAEFQDRSELLGHLEQLVAGWKNDGEAVYIEQSDASNPLVSSAGAGLVARPPEGVTYVCFGGSAPVIGDAGDTVVEGFYVREVEAEDGLSAEVTLVCAGAAWEEIGTARYSDAVSTLSRAAVGVIPIGQSLTPAEALSLFEGDAELLADPAIEKAWAMASFAIDTSIGIAPSLGMRMTCH